MPPAPRRASGQSGNYRGRSPEERASERRARLLEATLAVWSSAGGARVTMTRVCAEAGLTERYFYESFAGLDEALTAVMESVASEIETVAEAAADEAGQATGDDPAARVRAAVGAFVELIAADPRKGRVAILESAALPDLRARRTQLLRHFALLSAERFDAGPGAGDPRQRRMAALVLVGGLAELVSAWLDGTLEATPAEVTDAATAVFLDVLGPR